MNRVSNRPEKLDAEEWQEWLDSRGTREFFEYLANFKQSLLESLPAFVNEYTTGNQIVGKIELIDEMKTELKFRGNDPR